MRFGIAGSATAAELGVVGVVSPPGAAAGTAVLPASPAEGSFAGLRFANAGSRIAQDGDGLCEVP